MPFTIADMNRQSAALAAAQEAERKRKEAEERRKQEQERARLEAQQKAAAAQERAKAAKSAQAAQANKQESIITAPKAQQKTTAAQGVHRAMNPVLPVAPAPAQYKAPAKGSYTVLSKDPSQMNWAERSAYGKLTNQGQEYFDQLFQDTQTPGSPNYDVYLANKSTLQWAIDAFDGQWQNFGDDFFDATVGLRDLEHRLPDTLNISKAGMAGWTKQELQAYARNKLWMAKEYTEKGGTQWADLMTRAQDFYKTYEQGYGRKPTIDEFLASIDISKYPVLKDIDDSRNIGSSGSSSPVILTKGIGYSHEKLYGLYEALGRGEALDPSKDYLQDATKFFMRWQPEEEAPSAAKNYTSDHANNAANLTPSMAAAAREEIRTVGNRQADAELTEALYVKDHPEYSSYGIPPYTDDAYYAKMAPVFQPIIDANVQMDLNGQGTFPKPGKDDPPSVQQAYLFWQRWKKWEPDTKKVEAQLDAVINRLKAQYGVFKAEVDSGEMDLVKDLDWRDYPELASFMEGSGKINTTRPVYASEEALQGVIRALKDGQTEFSPDVDYAYYGGVNKPVAQGAQKPVQGPPSPDGRLAGEPRQTAPEAVQAPTAQPEQTTSAQQPPAGSTAAMRSWAPGTGTTSLTGENKDDTRDMANIRPEEATLPKVNLEGLSEGAIQLFKDQRLVTQEEIDAFKASKKTDESTGMVDAGAKGQSTTPEDVSKMPQEQVIQALKAVTAAQTAAQDPLNNTRKGAEMTAWMDEVQKLNDTYDILVDALHQFGMSDADIEKALGPNVYSDNGEMIPVNAAKIQKEYDAAKTATETEFAQAKSGAEANWAAQMAEEDAADEAAAAQAEADAAKQKEIDAVREQIRQLGIDIPTDPVALKKRNAEMSGLYAKLGELDAGPTIGAAATTPRQEINPPDRLPRNLEDWRTGFIDTVKSFGKAIIENDAAIREKMQGVAKALVANEAGKEAYPISTKAYDDLMAAHPDSPLTPQDWQQYYAVLDAENQGKTEAMPLEFMTQLDRMLPVDTPRFVKDAVAYSATIAGAVAERTNTEILNVTRNSASVVQNAYLYSNRNRYKALLGDGYTLGQVRAIDPVADKLTAAVEQFDLGGQAMRTDYTKPLGEFAEPLLGVYEFALDQGLMMATTRGLAGGLHRAIAPVVANALPYLEKLPGAVQKIASLSGTSALWILSNPHYMVRSYINGVDQARQDGATEEQANNVGLVMAGTDGIVEAGIGTLYEGVFSKAVKLFGKAIPGDIVKNLGAKGKSVLEYLGTIFSMAAGESAEEITQAGINAASEQAIMGKPAGWNTVGDLVWDLVSGHGYDAAKYENTLAGAMANNASAAFVDSIGLGIIMGMGGRLSHATQVQAEYILDQIAKDPDFKKYLDEARALDAKSPEAPAAPVEAPEAASVVTEVEKPAPEVKPAQEALATSAGPSAYKMMTDLKRSAKETLISDKNAGRSYEELEQRYYDLLDERDQLMEQFDVVHGSMSKLEGEAYKAAGAEETRLLNRIDDIDREAQLIREKQGELNSSAPEAPAPSPQAQMLVSFKQTAEKEIEEAAIKAETDARVQEEVDNGLLAPTESPTEPTFYPILQAENAMADLQNALKNIEAQMENGKAQMESMVRAAFKNMVPVEAGNPQKISWNTTEMMDRLGRERDKVLEKIESAKAELQLLYEKWQANRDEITDQRKAEVEAEVRSEVSDVYLRRQTKAKAFRLSVTEGQQDHSESNANYIDALTRTPNEDNMGWVNESEEDPGWGNSRQKEEEETSWQTMDREKNEEVRANGRGGAEGLDDKLANRRAALGTGGPKDGKGIPMVEVPKKVYDDMYQRFKGFLGGFMGPKSTAHIQGDKDSVSANFATRNVQGAPSQYELALKERNLKLQKPMKIKKMGYAGKDIVRWKKDRVSPNASMQVAPDKQQLTIERENLDESKKKLPNKVDTMSPVRRAWMKPMRTQSTASSEPSGKPAGYSTSRWGEGTTYSIVAQNKGYYILEDLDWTRKNLGLLEWQQDLEGIARDNGVDMSSDIDGVRKKLSPRFFVISRTFETDPEATNESGFPVGELAKYNPDELALYATTDLEEAMSAINGKKSNMNVPRQGGTVYYVSQDVLSQFNEKYAALTEADKASMSYEDYSKMVMGMIDEYAAEKGLTDAERNAMYGAKNLFTKAGKPGWVAIGQNNDFVVFANEDNDPLVNANVKSVDDALAVFASAVGQQYTDRTIKRGDGSWATESYHDEKTRNPKFQPDGSKSKVGTYYTREGTVIYSMTDPKTRGKISVKLGALDDTDTEHGRTFIPTNKILADAFSIDVNTFFGNNKVNFTIERNYGQARYGEFDQEIVTDEGGILRDMTREINAFSQLIDNPDVALPMRQRFMRNLLEAQIKQTEKELYDLTESFRNGVINPGVNQAAVNQYAYLKERKATLAEMQKAIQAGTKAEGEAVGAASKRFFDSLKAVDPIENQVTYDGMESDMAALDSTMKALAKADSPDTAKMAYDQLYLIKNRMEVALQHARRTVGGGALLAEYEWRIKSLDAKIKEVQADPNIPVENKALRVQELSAKLKRYTDNFYDMTASGVDFTTPSQLVVENGSEASYNLEEMTLHNLVQLRESTRAKADKEARRVAVVAGSDTAQLQRYRTLLSDIDLAIKAKPLPAPSVSSTADGTVAVDVKPEVRRGPTEKQPIVSVQAPIVTSDQIPLKKARDTSYTRQGAIALLEDVLDAPIDEIDERLAKYMLPRLYMEAQGMLTAYAQDGVTSPDAMTDTLHEAEGILSNIANGLPPFLAVENQTELQNETPVGEGGNVAESVAEHPVVNAIIEASEADETTKEEVREHAKSVAFDMTPTVTRSEHIRSESEASPVAPRNVVEEQTSDGSNGLSDGFEGKVETPMAPRYTWGKNKDDEMAMIRSWGANNGGFPDSNPEHDAYAQSLSDDELYDAYLKASWSVADAYDERADLYDRAVEDREFDDDYYEAAETPRAKYDYMRKAEYAFMREIYNRMDGWYRPSQTNANVGAPVTQLPAPEVSEASPESLTAGMPEFPETYEKPTDVRSARETVARFAEDLPVPMPEGIKSKRQQRLDALNAKPKAAETTETKPESKLKRVTESEMQKTLERYAAYEPEDFPTRPPTTMAELLAYKQMRSRISKEVNEIGRNIDKLAADQKSPMLTEADRDAIDDQKAKLVNRRTELRRISREISRAMASEEAYETMAFAEATERARQDGKSAFIAERMNDPAAKPENEIDNIDKALAEAEDYERKYGVSEKTAVDALIRPRSLKVLAMNLEIANACTAEAHRALDRADVLRQRVEVLETLGGFTEGEERLWAKANAHDLWDQIHNLETDAQNLESAADLYYRDSSTDARTAIFGNSRSGGFMPTSVVHTVVTMAKHAVGTQAGALRASGKWVGEIVNRAVETNPGRIIQNFLGKYASVFDGVYIEPVAEGNYRIKTSLQRYYDMIMKSGITMENEAIAHQYAEGKINFGELMAARPNDYKQIDEGIKVFRRMYDEVLEAVNETLTRNGFAPVPKRKNYFPHFKDGGNSLLAMLGLEENHDTIPLSMLGKTDQYRPFKQFVGNFLARRGGETDYGLITGAARYLPSVMQVTHQMNNIVRLRQLEEALSQSADPNMTPYQQNRLGHFKQYIMNYTNHLAGKKTGVDVLVGKSALGREALDFLRKVKQYRGLSLTFGSPTVVLSQLVSLGTAAAVAPTETAMAMAEMLHIVKDGDKAFDRDAFEALSKFLTRKYQGRPIPLTAWDNFLEKGQMATEHVERIISNVFVRAVYLQGLRQGLAEGPAMERADRLAWRALSSRNRGESGIAYNNVIGGTVLQFAREAVNNVMFLVKDMPTLSPDRKKNVASIVLLLLYNAIFNWMTGKQTALDPIGAVGQTVAHPDEGDNAWQTGLKALGAVADTGWPVSFDYNNGAKNLPVVAGFNNITSVGGSMLSGEFDWSDPTSYERIVSAALGFTPGGAQIEKTYRGVKAFAKGYNESNLGDIQFPVTQNPHDLILYTLLGTRSYGIGRWYRENNRKPLTNDQQEEFLKQYEAGIAPRPAFDAAIGTPAATRQTIAAKNTTKMGDERGGYDQGKEAAKAREALGAPSGMPAWAYDDYASKDTRIMKAIKAYGISDLTGLVPREVVDWVEQDGKRWEITEENRPYLEDRQQKWFRAYMDELGPNPTPQEVRNAIAKADAKAKADFLNKYWAK